MADEYPLLGGDIIRNCARSRGRARLLERVDLAGVTCRLFLRATERQLAWCEQSDPTRTSAFKTTGSILAIQGTTRVTSSDVALIYSIRSNLCSDCTSCHLALLLLPFVFAFFIVVFAFVVFFCFFQTPLLKPRHLHFNHFSDKKCDSPFMI